MNTIIKLFISLSLATLSTPSFSMGKVSVASRHRCKPSALKKSGIPTSQNPYALLDTPEVSPLVEREPEPAISDSLKQQAKASEDDFDALLQAFTDTLATSSPPGSITSSPEPSQKDMHEHDTSRRKISAGDRTGSNGKKSKKTNPVTVGSEKKALRRSTSATEVKSTGADTSITPINASHTSVEKEGTKTSFLIADEDLKELSPLMRKIVIKNRIQYLYKNIPDVYKPLYINKEIGLDTLRKALSLMLTITRKSFRSDKKLTASIRKSLASANSFFKNIIDSLQQLGQDPVTITDESVTFIDLRERK